mmetsp:Transcript_36642/g.72490  ORF Transcript_36642/g.72490 Transcript_36642/m.72490 type:complete len:503 (-) Transcript_36642:106-1614(-)
MANLRSLIVCALVAGAFTNDVTVGSTKILNEWGTAEHVLQSELHAHPAIRQQEMQLLRSAEDAVQHGHTARPSSKLIQQSSTQGVASGTGKILNELSAAEGMMKSELHGHPKILQEEMSLLHGAEDAARHTARLNTRLIQHKSTQSTGLSSGRILGELGQVEKMAQKVLAGHPKELELEESALHQAEHAAKVFARPALLVVGKTQGTAHQKVQVGTAQLLEERSRSMQEALQQERTYGAAESQLVKDGDTLVSDFGKIEDSIAQTFAGKDSKAVKTAMQVGELLDKARGEQQQVNKLNDAEATHAKKDAETLESAFAQTNSKSKLMQEQQAYTAGMSNLIKDEKSVLSQFSGLKTAVAQAFAGQDGRAIEKAMKVGELLDQARDRQKHVAQTDVKDAADASKLFQEISGHAQHPAKKTFLQKQGQSLTAAATHTSRMQSLASKEHGIVRLTANAEDAITHELVKDGSHEAMATEHEVIALMEQAKKAEQGAYAATARAVARK